jgi:hypothetical protein
MCGPYVSPRKTMNASDWLGISAGVIIVGAFLIITPWN